MLQHLKACPRAQPVRLVLFQELSPEFPAPTVLQVPSALRLERHLARFVLLVIRS
jgi:hypothetical protein